MLIGAGLLVLGYLVMSLDGDRYGMGFMGLTLGPIIITAGFIVEFFAIMHKPKESKDE